MHSFTNRIALFDLCFILFLFFFLFLLSLEHTYRLCLFLISCLISLIYFVNFFILFLDYLTFKTYRHFGIYMCMKHSYIPTIPSVLVLVCQRLLQQASQLILFSLYLAVKVGGQH